MTGALTNSIRLVAVATAVACARQFTARTLRTWNVLAATADDACLIASELVTNAVCATGSVEPDPSPAALASLPLIALRLTITREKLLIEVADASAEPPQLRQQYEWATGGRGLFLVAMLAERWSYYPEGTSGKVVWAALALPRNVDQDDKPTNDAIKESGQISPQHRRNC